MTYLRVVTRVARRAPLEEQGLPTIPEHLSNPTFFFVFFYIYSGVRVGYVVNLYVFTFSDPCCNIHCDLQVSTMFASSLLICFVSGSCFMDVICRVSDWGNL